MKLLIVSVGHKMPDWITAGFNEYAKRMPREARIELVEIRPEPRTTGKSVVQIMEAEAGRILHHLKHRIGDERNTILIVGFQAEHTLGRRLVEKMKTVRVFGREVDVRGVRVERLQARANPDRTVAVEAAFSARATP